MFKKIVNWFKNKLGILQLEKEIAFVKWELNCYKERLNDKILELEKHTRVDADIGYRGNNTIILTGVYRKRAYVYFYDMGDGEFAKLVDQLKEMKKYALIRHLDKPNEFHGIFDL
jgi:hypothetical protein